MAKRSAFLVQVLDKIGAPLLAAIEGSAQGQGDDKGVQDAQTLAALLGKAVEMSVHMSQNMDLKGSEEDADSVRLALAGLSGPLIAEVYKATGKVPDENDIKRMNKTMEAVLTFSDNFAPSATHISRLRSLNDEAIHADEDQNTIYVMQALLPVLGAVAEFPFGQPETALVQEIAGKLQAHATTMMGRLLGEDETDLGKARYVELMILRALGQVYAESHKAQTKKLLEQQQAGAEVSDITMQTVWQSFDLKMSMLEALIGASLPDGAPASAGGVAPVAPTPEPAPQPEMPAQAPVAPEQAAAPPPPMPPVEQQVAPVAPPPAAPPAAAEGNPMTFFKPGTQPPAAGEPQQPPPPPETPQPAQPPVTPPPAEVPPAQPPAETPPPSPAPETPPPADASGNPMAFFKPGTKNTDESGQT